MDPAFDSARSAGYRDVVVNLQLVGKDAEQLGVERHICEVQLILVSFFERKVQNCCKFVFLASGIEYSDDFCFLSSSVHL
jgi:hypothetical protein